MTGSYQLYAIKSLFKSLLNFISKFKKGESSTKSPTFNKGSCKECSLIVEEENLKQPTKIPSTCPGINYKTILPSESKDFPYDPYRGESRYPECHFTIDGERITMMIRVNTSSPASERIRMIKEVENKYEVEIIKLVSVKIDDANHILTYEVKPIESVGDGELDEEEIAIPPNIPSEMIFSYSKISLFNNCPKAYEFKYMLKTPELLLTVEQHLGKSVHSALKNIYEAKSAGKSISLSLLLNAYHQAWDSPEIKNIKIIKKNTSFNDYYLNGKNMLEKYYQRILVPDRSDTIALEKLFNLKLTNEIYYRGYIDRISQEPNGKLRIIDFKTGKRVNNPEEDMQLRSYALWLFEIYQDDEIEIVFEALRHGKTFCSKLRKSQLPAIREKLLTDINKINSTEKFEANPSILCSWCAYFDECDYIDSGICPLCGGDLEEREGRRGSFIGCRKYPMCRYTREDW